MTGAGTHTPAQDVSTRPSRLQLAVLVIVPVVVFGALAVGTLMFIGTVAMLSAMGHGSLTAEEARPYWIAGAMLTIGGTVLASRFLEWRILGRKAERTPVQTRVARNTRIAWACLSIALVVSTPLTWSETTFRLQASRASSQAGDDRFGAIHYLGQRRSARAYAVLHRIAADGRDDGYARAQALLAMSFYSNALPDIAALASDPEPHVRAGAGAALLNFADDPQAWALIEQLTRDEVLLVREQMAQAIAQSRVSSISEEKRSSLLKEIAQSDSPGAALSASRVLGADGYDTAWKTLTEGTHLDGTRVEAIKVLGSLQDARALPLLRRIVFGTAGELYLQPDSEDQYRNAANEAILSIMTRHQDGEEWVAYSNEYAARNDLQQVLEAQRQYSRTTGFFDGRLACLELPSLCVAGHDPDTSLIGPALASGMTRRGYTRRLIAGPPAQRHEIAAKNASSTSVTAFAFLVVPEVPSVSGIRAYCGDDTGTICYTRDGRTPPVANGRCRATDVPAGVPGTPRVCQGSR